MIRPTNNNNGFSAVEVLLLIALVGAIIFAGLYLSNKNGGSKSQDQANPETSQEEINDAQDLQDVENELENVNLDELESSDLDEAEAELL